MNDIKLFCYNNLKLQQKFEEEDSYKIILGLERSINDYAKQLKAVKRVIGVLERWKNEEFYNKDISYEVDWFGCYKADENIKDLTLSEAKKLYKEIKVKYDTLFEVFTDAERVHCKDNLGGLIDKYFTDIE